MAILQISTSNTFAQWLSTTQQLVEKYNFIEANANVVFSTANTVANTNTYIQTFVSDSTNTINVLIANATINVTTAQSDGYANVITAQSDAYANIITVQSDAYANVNTIYGDAVTISILVQDKSNTTNTTAQTVFDYVETAYDTANTSNAIANEALVTAQLAFNIANNALSNVEIQAIATASYTHANGAFDKANSASNTAQASFNTANIANSKVVTITNDTTSDKTIYLLLSDQTSNNLITSNVSTTKLYFNPSTGTLSSTNYNSLSDVNLKNNIITIVNPIETIKQIDGVSFNWNDNGNKSYGVIAQELEKILPELVEGDDVKTVNYTGLIAFLINGIKELDNRVTQLENGINK
jgi:hypothetical protein